MKNAKPPKQFRIPQKKIRVIRANPCQYQSNPLPSP